MAVCSPIKVMKPNVTTKWIRNKEGHKEMENNAAIAQWMKQHNLIPKESFAAALRRLARHYQRENHIRSMEDVYQKIGLRKEYLYYWEKHPYSTQTKNFKYKVIRAAAREFRIDTDGEERLANKAGLSMKADAHFQEYLISLIENKTQIKKIYEHAQISERMFQYIKHGRIPTKQSLIAIAAALELGLEEIKQLLSKAGYALSDSIAWDMIVETLLKQIEATGDYRNAVARINDVLFDLGLPLLMTREKKNRDN